MKYTSLIFCVIIFYQNINVFAIQCKNEKDEPVDWFVLYKFPKIKENVNKLIKNGLAYAYMTSKDYTNGWVLSDLSMNDSSSVTGLTLDSLYKQKRSLHLLYNDEPPDEPTRETGGHTKGFILANSTHGLWMVHSVPHYPLYKDSNSKYEYPNSGLNNGQSFLCLSLNIAQIDLVGQQLLYNEPYLYSKYISPELVSLMPNIFSVFHNETIKSAPWYNIVDISSVDGQRFKSFAKSRRFKKELYVDLVAPTLQTDLLVETWQNERDKLKSNCTRPFRVRNIQGISFSQYKTKFLSSKDHSKWTIEDRNSSLGSYVCIGDINRDEHQLYRGGGTVCFQNKHVFNHYLTTINKIEQC